MRFLALLAASVAFLLPAASAQLSSPVLTIDQVAIGSSSLDPGDSTVVRVTFTRTCPNAATLYPEAPADVAVVAMDPNWTVEGPLQAVFPQQVCAQGMTQSIEVSYEVTAPRDAERDALHSFIARGRVHAASQMAPPSNEAMFPFTIATTPAPAVEPAMDEPVRESPSLGALGAVLALVAGVVAIPRRR